MSMPATNEQLVETIIRRTQENLLKCKDIVDNDVTFYLNSMIGLLVIPKEKLYYDITDDMMDSNLIGKVKACVAKGYKTELKEIVTHLRNSVSHGHISFVGEKPPLNSKPAIITDIIFKDYSDKKYTKQSYEMTIGIDLFKIFVTEFSAASLKLSQERR